ncbi:hypothetical protein [Pedobacter sp. SYSU D00535]|uniref:hypothetical protein n=1 Tax=Pedobacter sp. SYSU D00535 TaxID=2810308 RepID=UPI001A95EC0B|nr:hypothetical protein [Pedobacter sp. SYSU D00535]
MKKLKILIPLFAVIFASCSKDRDTQTDFSRVKIASISGIGDFNYEGDKLVSIGNEIFFYTGAGRIAGSRSHQKDSLAIRFDPANQSSTYIFNEKLEKSSYIWANDKVTGRIIDTLFIKSYRKESSQSGEPVPGTITTSLLTGIPADHYSYTDKRLDSIASFSYAPNQRSVKKHFLYNTSGDLTKIIEYSSAGTSLPFPPLITNKTEIEISYDNKPNPFYYLYKNTGVIPNKLSSFIVSRHNPVRLKMTTFINGQTNIEVIRDISYEYNSDGLPVKIIYRTPLIGEQNRVITYK